MTMISARKGFSLIEMIVASIILSLAVVTICAVSNKSMAAVRSNREYEDAWDLLDRQLMMIDYIGVEEFIEEGNMSGQFGSEGEEGQTVHYWTVKHQEGEYDNLYRIDVTISWKSAGSIRSISASTILNGSGILQAEEEQEETETEQ